VYEIVTELGLPITVEEAATLQPVFKAESELVGGELTEQEVFRVYRECLLARPDTPFEFLNLQVEPDQRRFVFEINYNHEPRILVGEGTGPIDACVRAVESLGLYFHLVEYAQHALDIEHLDSAAEALSEIKIQRRPSPDAEPEGPVAVGRGMDPDTIKANVKALFNGMNRLLA
jgi:hypothetical protein